MSKTILFDVLVLISLTLITCGITEEYDFPMAAIVLGALILLSTFFSAIYSAK